MKMKKIKELDQLNNTISSQLKYNQFSAKDRSLLITNSCSAKAD